MKFVFNRGILWARYLKDEEDIKLLHRPYILSADEAYRSTTVKGLANDTTNNGTGKAAFMLNSLIVGAIVVIVVLVVLFIVYRGKCNYFQ